MGCARNRTKTRLCQKKRLPPRRRISRQIPVAVVSQSKPIISTSLAVVVVGSRFSGRQVSTTHWSAMSTAVVVVRFPKLMCEQTPMQPIRDVAALCSKGYAMPIPTPSNSSVSFGASGTNSTIILHGHSRGTMITQLANMDAQQQAFIKHQAQLTEGTSPTSIAMRALSQRLPGGAANSFLDWNEDMQDAYGFKFIREERFIRRVQFKPNIEFSEADFKFIEDAWLDEIAAKLVRPRNPSSRYFAMVEVYEWNEKQGFQEEAHRTFSRVLSIRQRKQNMLQIMKHRRWLMTLIPDLRCVSEAVTLWEDTNQEAALQCSQCKRYQPCGRETELAASGTFLCENNFFEFISANQKQPCVLQKHEPNENDPVYQKQWEHDTTLMQAILFCNRLDPDRTHRMFAEVKGQSISASMFDFASFIMNSEDPQIHDKVAKLAAARCYWILLHPDTAAKRSRGVIKTDAAMPLYQRWGDESFGDISDVLEDPVFLQLRADPIVAGCHSKPHLHAKEVLVLCRALVRVKAAGFRLYEPTSTCSNNPLRFLPPLDPPSKVVASARSPWSPSTEDTTPTTTTTTATLKGSRSHANKSTTADVPLWITHPRLLYAVASETLRLVSVRDFQDWNVTDVDLNDCVQKAIAEVLVNDFRVYSKASFLKDKERIHFVQWREVELTPWPLPRHVDFYHVTGNDRLRDVGLMKHERSRYWTAHCTHSSNEDTTSCKRRSRKSSSNNGDETHVYTQALTEYMPPHIPAELWYLDTPLDCTDRVERSDFSKHQRACEFIRYFDADTKSNTYADDPRWCSSIQRAYKELMRRQNLRSSSIHYNAVTTKPSSSTVLSKSTSLTFADASNSVNFSCHSDGGGGGRRGDTFPVLASTVKRGRKTTATSTSQVGGESSSNSSFDDPPQKEPSGWSYFIDRETGQPLLALARTGGFANPINMTDHCRDWCAKQCRQECTRSCLEVENNKSTHAHIICAHLRREVVNQALSFLLLKTEIGPQMLSISQVLICVRVLCSGLVAYLYSQFAEYLDPEFSSLCQRFTQTSWRACPELMQLLFDATQLSGFFNLFRHLPEMQVAEYDIRNNAFRFPTHTQSNSMFAQSSNAVMTGFNAFYGGDNSGATAPATLGRETPVPVLLPVDGKRQQNLPQGMTESLEWDRDFNDTDDGDRGAPSQKTKQLKRFRFGVSSTSKTGFKRGDTSSGKLVARKEKIPRSYKDDLRAQIEKQRGSLERSLLWYATPAQDHHYLDLDNPRNYFRYLRWSHANLNFKPAPWEPLSLYHNSMQLQMSSLQQPSSNIEKVPSFTDTSAAIQTTLPTTLPSTLSDVIVAVTHPTEVSTVFTSSNDDVDSLPLKPKSTSTPVRNSVSPDRKCEPHMSMATSRVTRRDTVLASASAASSSDAAIDTEASECTSHSPTLSTKKQKSTSVSKKRGNKNQKTPTSRVGNKTKQRNEKITSSTKCNGPTNVSDAATADAATADPATADPNIDLMNDDDMSPTLSLDRWRAQWKQAWCAKKDAGFEFITIIASNVHVYGNYTRMTFDDDCAELSEDEMELEDDAADDIASDFTRSSMFTFSDYRAAGTGRGSHLQPRRIAPLQQDLDILSRLVRFVEIHEAIAAAAAVVVVGDDNINSVSMDDNAYHETMWFDRNAPSDPPRRWIFPACAIPATILAQHKSQVTAST